jgi:hypothetical protein
MHVVVEHAVDVARASPTGNIGSFSQQAFEALNRLCRYDVCVVRAF